MSEALLSRGLRWLADRIDQTNSAAAERRAAMRKRWGRYAPEVFMLLTVLLNSLGGAMVLAGCVKMGVCSIG